MRLDENIKKDIVDQLYWDDRVNAASVSVNVMDGTVTLTGNVPTYKARLSATEDAWKIDGVTNVRNQLVVFYTSSAKMPSDSELENRARKAIFWNSDIDAANITIEVNNGVATLSGSVNFYWKKWETEKIVSHIYGITDIINHLTIVATQDRTDKDIAKNIEDALARNIHVDSENVIVKVADSVVTLTGIVANGFIRSQAEDVAKYTAGVTNVDNRLKVQLDKNNKNQ